MSMNDNNAISPIDTKALSNIFITEQDKEGTSVVLGVSSAVLGAIGIKNMFKK